MHKVFPIIKCFVQGGGVYSGVFRPSSDGIYAISAFFEAASSCTDPADLCAPEDFQASLLSAVFVEVTGAASVDVRDKLNTFPQYLYNLSDNFLFIVSLYQQE